MILLYIIEYHTVECPASGQLFQSCGGSCRRTCTDVIEKKSSTCVHYCKPGCSCPAGQV